ncbi:MAG: YfaZ family outer membrane protein [Gammaproteobacteria bacterium]
MRILVGPVPRDLPIAFIACATLLITLAVVKPVRAHELDLSLNDNAFRVSYAAVLRDNLRLDGGWLRDDDEGDVFHAGFQVTGDAAPGDQKMTAGVGVRLALLDGDGDNREGYALGIGGSVRWAIPRYNRFAVYGEYYWAPDILSGGDAEKYVDGTIRLGYSVTPQAEIYIGARYTGADFDNRPSILFDTGMHAGIDLRF